MKTSIRYKKLLYLHLEIKLPEAKYIRKCDDFTCWDAFTVTNIRLPVQQC